MSNNNYQRLLSLKEQIDKNTATSEEKNEYMKLMYTNGHITKKQYDDYTNNKNSDDLIKAAIAIGGVMLATWLIQKLID